MIVKNTTAEKVYLPIYQPETAPNALNAFVPASATVDLVVDGNAAGLTPAQKLTEIANSSILKDRVNDGTFVLVVDGIELSAAHSPIALAVIIASMGAIRSPSTGLIQFTEQDGVTAAAIEAKEFNALDGHWIGRSCNNDAKFYFNCDQEQYQITRHSSGDTHFTSVGGTMGFSFNGATNVASLKIGGTEITATPAALNYVDLTSSAQTQIDSKEDAADKGAANGYCPLDGSSKIASQYLNVEAMEYKGGWNASTNSPTLADGTGDTGDVYIVTTAGTVLGEDWEVGDSAVYNGSTAVWDRVGRADAVNSVAGKTGVVTLDSSDVGLGNCDNTSDADKPVSTAQQTALNLKADANNATLTGVTQVAEVDCSGIVSGSEFRSAGGHVKMKTDTNDWILYLNSIEQYQITRHSSGNTHFTSQGGSKGFSFNGPTNVQSLQIGDAAITADAGELNLMDGVTATTSEINYLSGVSSGIQAQIDSTVSATAVNTLAISSNDSDISALNSSVSTNTLNIAALDSGKADKDDSALTGTTSAEYIDCSGDINSLEFNSAGGHWKARTVTNDAIFYLSDQEQYQISRHSSGNTHFTSAGGSKGFQFNGDTTVSGDLAVTGTVDGVDVAALGTEVAENKGHHVDITDESTTVNVGAVIKAGSYIESCSIKITEAFTGGTSPTIIVGDTSDTDGIGSANTSDIGTLNNRIISNGAAYSGNVLASDMQPIVTVTGSPTAGAATVVITTRAV